MVVVRKLARPLAVAIIACCVAGVARGAESVDVSEVFTFVVSGLRAERQRIRQGVFRAHGQHSRQEPESVGRTHGPVEIFGAFEFDQHRYRWDSRSPYWDGTDEPEVMYRTIYRTRELSGHYNSRIKRFEIHLPEIVNPPSLAYTRGYLDIRCVGLHFNFGALLGSIDLDSACEQVLLHPPDGGVEESPGIYRFEWITSEMRHRWWVDTSDGFTPIRRETAFRLPELGEVEWRSPKQTQHIGWTRFGETWVPISFRMFERIELRPEKWPEPPDYEYTPRHRDVSYEWNFEWESVNAPVRPEFFDWEHIDFPDGTYIADMRTGEAKIIHVVLRGNEGWNFVEPPGVLGRDRVWGMLLAGLLLVLLGTLTWRRGRSARDCHRKGSH